jgi:hypothetical protein
MSFSFLGGTITQTGTDTDLSGLSGIAGVTTYSTTDRRTFYMCDATITKLDISGTLSYDPDYETLSFVHDTANEAVAVTSGGIFTIGVLTTINGIDRYSTGDALFIPDTDGSISTESALVVKNGGTFVMNGGTIYHGNANGVQSGGSVTINKGRFVNTADETQNTQYFRIEGASTDMEVYDVEIDSLRPSTSVPILFALNGIDQFSGTLKACAIQNKTGAHTGALVLKNIVFSQNVAPIDFLITGITTTTSSQATEITNVDIGSNFRFDFNLTNGTNTAHLALFQEVDFTVKDTSNTNIEGAKVCLKTTDSGNRVNAGTNTKFINNRDFTGSTYDLYEADTDSSGNSGIFTVLTGRIWDDDTGAENIEYDLYSKSQVAGTEDFDFKFISYLHNYAAQEVILKSAIPLSFNQILTDDTIITEQDKATVAAYTTQETPYKAYDQLKSILVDNYAGETNTIATRSENTLNAGAYDVAIDGTGSGSVTFDGTTITLNASTFTGNITTTGAVTLLNGAVVVGTIIDSTANSSLTFSGIDSWIVYPTEVDRDANTNSLGSGLVLENYRFNFVASTIYYLRLTTGEDTIFKPVTPLNSGETEVALTIAGLLTVIPTLIDQAVTNSLDGTDLPGTTALAVRSELTTELARLDVAVSTRNDKDQADARQVILIAKHDATKASLDGKPALAQIEASTIIAKEATLVTRATPSDVANALADYDAPTKTEMDSAFTEIKGAGWSTETLKDIRDNAGGGLDEGELHTALDSYTNKNNWKATGFATPTNVTDARDAVIVEVNANEEKIDAIPTAAQIATEILDNNNTV